MNSPNQGRAGLGWALVAYGLWGLIPIYWKQLSSVGAMEVLAHRVVWSVIFTAGVLLLQGKLRAVLRTLLDRALLKTLLLSTALIATNWGLFIWAVSENRVTEASLGYYINPLLNVVLARVFLGERLRGLQLPALALAGAAVLYLTVAQGSLPWVSLVLAVTFSWYGLVRKRAPIGPLVGLTVESGLAAPVAIGYLLMLDPPLANMVTAPASIRALLAGAGVITALPLLAFAAAAHRLRYTTLGMVQYLAPSLQLACAVLLYGEPFRREQFITFALIWIAVALYIAEALRSRPMSTLPDATP